MRLPMSFKRLVTAGPTLWTLDVLPKDANGNFLPPKTPTANTANGALFDNVLSIKSADRTGVAATNIVIGYQGPATAPDLVADVYVWDRAISTYYRMNATAGQALKQGVLNFFPVAALSDAPLAAGSIDQALTGGSDYVIIVTPSGTVVGTYFFACGAVV